MFLLITDQRKICECIEDRAGISIKVQDWQNRKTRKTAEFLREMRRVHDGEVAITFLFEKKFHKLIVFIVDKLQSVYLLKLLLLLLRLDNIQTGSVLTFNTG